MLMFNAFADSSSESIKIITLHTENMWSIQLLYVLTDRGAWELSLRVLIPRRGLNDNVVFLHAHVLSNIHNICLFYTLNG